MERRMTATEARVHFGELLREVAENESRVVVERSGRPKRSSFRSTEYDRLRKGKSPLAEWLDEADGIAKRIQRGMNGRPMPDADELIDGGRQDRDDAVLGILLDRSRVE